MCKLSFVIPKNLMIGLATIKEEEPVILKTNRIISICQFDVIPQRSFKFAIILIKLQKYNFQ